MVEIKGKLGLTFFLALIFITLIYSGVSVQAVEPLPEVSSIRSDSVPIQYNSMSPEAYQLQKDKNSSEFHSWSLPDFPKAGNPVLEDAPFHVNIVFVGVPEALVDENVLRSQLLSWYAPINRMKRIYTDRITVYVNYTFNYRITYSDSSFANAYSQFLLSNFREDMAPWWLQNQTVERAMYVRAERAEEWLAVNTPSDILDSGYTIFILDTYHTSPSIEYYYFYNGSIPDRDVGFDASIDSSQFMIAYGGNYRFLFLDLSAGPSGYRDVGYYVYPIWYYDSSKPDDVVAFSQDVAFYVNTAINLRFTPSWLYRPRYHPSYHVQVTIFSNESFNYVDYIDIDEILTQYQALQPYSSFSGDVIQVDLADDPALYNVVQEAYMPEEGYVNPDDVVDYLLNNLDSYVSPHGDDEVLPIFIFGGISFGGLLGRSCSDEKGDPAFVIEAVDQAQLGLVWSGGYWDKTSGWLNSGKLYWVRGLLTGNMELEVKIDVGSGKVDFFLLDLYNWKRLLNDQTWNSIYSDVWSKGPHQKTFKPTSVGGVFYCILSNPYSRNAYLDIEIIRWLRQGYGLTATTIHEAGHSFCLSHPHDGFSWRLFDEEPKEYVWWLWDFSATPMTYAAQNFVFDQLDFDANWRGRTLETLNYTFNRLGMVDSELNRLGFETVPPNVMGNVTIAVDHVNRAIDSFSSSSPNYADSFELSTQALNQAELAYLAYKASLLNISNQIQDADGDHLSGAEVIVAYPNGTTTKHYTDRSGYFTLSGAPWGNYTYTVYWQGSKVSRRLRYSEKASVDRAIQVGVYRLRLSFIDDVGSPLYKTPSIITLIAPNGSLIRTDAAQVLRVQNGTWTITSILWQGNNIVPTSHLSISLSENYEWQIKCRVYSIMFDKAVRDVNGESLYKPATSITLSCPNGSSTILDPSRTVLLQNGTYTFKAILWQGVDVNPTPEITFDPAEGPPSVNCYIYSIYFMMEDDEGRALENARCEVACPNGTALTSYTDPEGKAYLHQIPFGSYEALVYWMGVKVGSLRTSVSEGASYEISCSVYDLTVEVKDLLGLPAPGSGVRIYWPNGTFLTSDTTDARGNAKFLQLPEGEYRVEASQFLAAAKTFSLTRTLEMTLTITSYMVLGVGVVVPLVVVLVALFIFRRRRLSVASAVAPPPPPPQMFPTCPTCGQSLVYIQEYNRWYCPKCRRYMQTS